MQESQGVYIRIHTVFIFNLCVREPHYLECPYEDRLS